MNTTFQDKNISRREAYRAANGREAREARRRRRIYGGTFGLAPSHIFNELAVGTNAPVRTSKESQS